MPVRVKMSTSCEKSDFSASKSSAGAGRLRSSIMSLSMAARKVGGTQRALTKGFKQLKGESRIEKGSLCPQGEWTGVKDKGIEKHGEELQL